VQQGIARKYQQNDGPSKADTGSLVLGTPHKRAGPYSLGQHSVPKGGLPPAYAEHGFPAVKSFWLWVDIPWRLWGLSCACPPVDNVIVLPLWL
jgi:hypothetical protein